MNFPCPNAIRCNLPPSAQGYDFPVANFSSERPDKPIYIGRNSGWDYNLPPLGDVWQTLGCVAWCISNTSQEDADLCAAAQQYLCVTTNTPDPGPDGPSPPVDPTGPTITPSTPTPDEQPQPQPTNFFNSIQTCTYTCPNTGQVFLGIIQAGTVVARSQNIADAIAFSLACKQARQKALCVESLDITICANETEIPPEFAHAFSVVSVNPPVTWAAGSGQLPPGLVLENTGLLHGFPTQAGSYPFTIIATDSAGHSTDVDCHIDVLGFTDDATLPEAKVDHPYSHQLNGTPDAQSYDIVDGALPAGMTMSDSGLISGTCTTIQTASFTVAVLDENEFVCTKTFAISVTGPKFTNSPPNGTQCAAYNFTFTTTPTPCTFSGSVPGGLAMSAAGVVTGVPSTVGVNTFSISATDAFGHTNTATFTINVAADGTGIAKAMEDTNAWTPATILLPALCTFSGSIVDGQGTININRPVGSGAGTMRIQWDTILSRCALEPPYTLNWTLVFNYNQTNPDIKDNILLKLNDQTVYSGVGAASGFSASGSITVNQNVVLKNCLLDINLGSSKIATDAFTGSVTLTTSPLAPP